MVEIYPKPENSQDCELTEIDSTFINHRSLNSKTFVFTDHKGFSPNDPVFSYYRTSNEYTLEFPFEIYKDSVVSGHIISNNIGLVMEIYQNENVKE